MRVQPAPFSASARPAPAPITIALNKRFGVLSRFSPDGSKHPTLEGMGMPRGVWPVGRLDHDSEGLLILSSDKSIVSQLLSPTKKREKIYLAQVERVPDDAALDDLRRGILVDGKLTLPARARILVDEPALWDRDPPIRFRKSIPTAWIELAIVEGRNRQVRKMTAAVGHPTLRLVRIAIGALTLADLKLAPHAWRVLTAAEVALLFSTPAL